MTNDDVARVQQSWMKLQPEREAAAELFFRKLFELDPSLRARFTGDMAAQRARLMQMVGAAVRGLERLDALLPVIRGLGMRHAVDGVKDEHYGAAATALLWTLEHALQEDFTLEVKSAWIKVYGVLSQTMREANGGIPRLLGNGGGLRSGGTRRTCVHG